MNSNRIHTKDRMLKTMQRFFSWLVLGVIVGAAGGLLGAVFHHCVDAVTALRTVHPWFIFLLPAGGLLIAKKGFR